MVKRVFYGRFLADVYRQEAHFERCRLARISWKPGAPTASMTFVALDRGLHSGPSCRILESSPCFYEHETFGFTIYAMHAGPHSEHFRASWFRLQGSVPELKVYPRHKHSIRFAQAMSAPQLDTGDAWNCDITHSKN